MNGKEWHMHSTKTHLGQGGRIVLPADYRKALGLKAGDDVVLVLDQNEVRLIRPDEAIKRAQALVRRYVSKGRPLAEELIADRRQEARREAPAKSGTRSP
jgi:AbrB family looped-hinge helix DNA binding protein